MILIIGGYGNMGRRYATILKHIGEEFKIFDDPSNDNNHEIGGIAFDRAIICTPTRHHFDYCKKLLDMDKPFLCEKPLTFDRQEAEALMQHPNVMRGHVVNNWTYALGEEKFDKLVYNYYHTGNDGLIWDVCQLVLLADRNKAKLSVFRKSPIFMAVAYNAKTKMYTTVTLEDIHQSYVTMLKNFCKGKSLMNGSLIDGAIMTGLCHSLIKSRMDEGIEEHEDILWDSSKNRIYSPARKSL